ncbi:MAG: sulfate adenylyltransferase [Deltaproteobacteria bacterium]|jgi:sulfate adenylyltransferase large subunit|nr:sulfate adenylyltransferase [Deltaproteobacteria bacterium]
MEETTREQLTLVVTGHVDHGKSTVIGRLLFETGSLPKGAVDRVRAISKETGQPFEYAFLLDAFEEERKQGITIDTTRLRFGTARRDYVIIDAPGHKEFLKNMISGASDAEAAFLVVDAERGVEEQTRRHGHMLSLLGMTRVGVIVNKMDLVGFREEAFEKIRRELSAFLLNLGVEAGPFVPLSALKGLNVLKPAKEFSWHRGETLAGALDSLSKVTRPETLRFPLQDVYKFDDRRILAGRLESGRIAVGDEVLISPGGKRTRVASVVSWPETGKTSASAGESVGITVADEFFNRRGEVVTAVDDAPPVASSFTASVFWMGKKPLEKGKTYKLKLATESREAGITEIHNLIDSNDLAPRKGISMVSFNEVAEVEIETEKPLALDLFQDHRVTGRFVLVDGHDVAGGGIVTGIREAEGGRGKFERDDIFARCEVFDEYLYDLSSFRVTIKPGKSSRFTVGDPLPLNGRSYDYPENVDIVIFRDRVAVSVRDGIVRDISRIDDYAYGDFPLVNGRGFALKVSSDGEWTLARDAFLAEGSKDREELARRYLDFNAYRRISFAG